MQLTVAVYGLTKDFHREELYGLTSQIRRSAISIPCNIAEGQGRNNLSEFKQFLGIARGSNCELQTQLELAIALNFSNPELQRETNNLSHEVGKMIYAFLESLKG